MHISYTTCLIGVVYNFQVMKFASHDTSFDMGSAVLEEAIGMLSLLKDDGWDGNVNSSAPLRTNSGARNCL